ncbi:hypothetical protein HF846_16480 [Clostridium cadaveris]|uniref:Uncharacterized protein n=1 Tax=Clostridium cadaveris TaxID=1529 RepID=A0A316M936_9CLOT|nr:hypothetical protein [Clostridium cadaveris]NME66176.1 hypothetical protein [Clostridium cadaveris]PWL55052.1 MAG: hypothetical protein DBY38_02805 [Clostridium cadaveris]
MNKKVIIGGLAVVVLLGIGGYSIVKKNKKKEANNIKIEQQKEVESLNKNELNNSIKGLSDQELIKKYLLLKDSKVPVKDRVEASEVARKFVKAITEYSSDDPNKGEKEALSCVSEEIYKDIQGMFITKESDNTIENIVVDEEYSEETYNHEKNDYIFIKVRDGYYITDKYNQKREDVISYVVQLLKINGQYKVISFKR